MTENATMILAAAFCPAPPLLHPAMLGPAGRETGSTLRSACSHALHRVLATDPDAVLVLGAAGPPFGVASERVSRITSEPSDVRAKRAVYGRGDAGDFSGFGVPVRIGFDGPPRDGAADLPLPHTLGAWLLDEAGFTGRRLGLTAGTRPPDLLPSDADDHRWALLIMGDASARRTEKSPGWYDPHAAAFDDSVTAALAGGDGRALRDLDHTVGERVLAAGLSSWQEAGAILEGTPMAAQVHYADAPFGVFYVVASWVRQ